MKSVSLFLVLLLVAGCSSLTTLTDRNKVEQGAIVGRLDQVSVQLTIPVAAVDADSLIALVTTPLGAETILHLLKPNLDDSSRALLSHLITSSLPAKARARELTYITHTGDTAVLTFTLDTLSLRQQINTILSGLDPSLSVYPLFQKNPHPPDFHQLAHGVFLYPCEGIPIPKKASRLPNAPREYRSGIHRGIDFFAAWGTPVRAVADGVVIRSDRFYEEISPEFRNTLLKAAHQLHHTPSDVFNSILVGKAVIIDHGLDLFPGYRAITIYAHLSSIHPRIKPGYLIKAGEVFGQTGNTGTLPSTLGTREGSHLHWELILQDERGEYYFGQGLPYPDLYKVLNSLFKS